MRAAQFQQLVDERVQQVALDDFYADLEAASEAAVIVEEPQSNADPTWCDVCQKRFPDADALARHCKVSQSHRELAAAQKKKPK